MSDDEIIDALGGLAGAAPSPFARPSTPEETTFRLILVTAHRVAVETQARIDSGTGAMGLLVLQLLTSKRPPVTVQEVAESLGCSRQAASRLLQSLEQRGLIERTRFPWGPIKTLSPSAAVLERWESMHAPLRAVVRHALSTLTDDEKRTFIDLLDRIESNVRQLHAERRWGDGGRALAADLGCSSVEAESDPTRRSWVHVR